jgi:hypothetical protein
MTKAQLIGDLKKIIRDERRLVHELEQLAQSLKRMPALPMPQRPARPRSKPYRKSSGVFKRLW